MFSALREAWALHKAPLIAGIVVLAVIAFTIWLGGERKDAADDAVTQDRAGGLYNTIIIMEDADNAAENLERSPDARRTECMRHARNPEDC